MNYDLRCEHDKTYLTKEEIASGTIYKCPKCKCVYRLMLVHNDNECWKKRFPVKKT